MTTSSLLSVNMDKLIKMLSKEDTFPTYTSALSLPMAKSILYFSSCPNRYNSTKDDQQTQEYG